MEVLHTRSQKKLRLRRALRVFGQERETVEEAFAGDIVGLVNPGEFRLGDTICEGPPLRFEPLPQFSPENFAILECRDNDRRKQFRRGMTQLVEEGAIQVFTDCASKGQKPILAAVGELQFDVVRYRLESEYDTPTQINWLPYQLARWIADEREDFSTLRLPYTAKRVRDQYGHDAVLFKSQWDADYTARNNPDWTFTEARTGTATEFDQQQAAIAW
jgi:peptide chain release factor 3